GAGGAHVVRGARVAVVAGGAVRRVGPAGRRRARRADLAGVGRVRRPGGVERAGDEAAPGAAPPAAHLTGAAARPVGLRRVGAGARRRAARAGVVARVDRRARHRGAAGARPRLAGLALRTRVAVAASRRVGDVDRG